MAELDRTAWTYSYCEPHSLQHFFTDVSEYEQSNNLAIVVEDIEVNTDPESLTVMLFQGEAGDEPPVDPTIDDADASMTRALGKTSLGIADRRLSLHTKRHFAKKAQTEPNSCK